MHRTVALWPVISSLTPLSFILSAAFNATCPFMVAESMLVMQHIQFYKNLNVAENLMDFSMRKLGVKGLNGG
jgi:hypothetical protein